MLFPLIITYLLLSIVQNVSGASDECALACQYPMSEITFDSTDPTVDYYANVCTNRLLTQSVFLCMRYHCTDEEIGVGLSEFGETCQEDGSVSLLLWSIIGNISNDQYLAWPHIEYDGLASTTIYSTPVFISQDLFDLSYKTIVDWDDSLQTRARYGYALFGFFAIVFVVSLIHRVFHFISRRRHLCLSADRASSIWHTFRRVYRKNVSVPALFTHRTAEPTAWGMLPPRLQSITIMAFVIVNIVLCSVNYELFEKNLYWRNTRTQLWRYLSDRTGVLAIANFPLIWTFGMRNNILLWLTGWSFSTFNSFHRWVARVATVEAILHSVGYTVEAFLDGGKAEFVGDWSEQYWWMGVIATISMSFLCVFAVYPMRRYTYELFLLLHVVFAVLCLIGMWYHVAIFEGEYNPYIWPCVGVWALDRALRLGRLGYLNLFKFQATVKYNKDADIVHVIVPVRALLRPRAGTYYFLYSLNGLKFWESHPFTLMSWRTVQAENTNDSIHELSFLFRPRDSFTARLRNHVSQKPDNHNEAGTSQTHIRVAIEGPYGHPFDVSHYPSVLMVVGGTGVTVALSHLRMLRETVERSEVSGIPIRRVQLVWAVRHLSIFEDVYQHELLSWDSSQGFSSQVKLDIEIYVTGNDGVTPASSGTKYAQTEGLSQAILKESGIDDKINATSKFPVPGDTDSTAKITVVQHRPPVQSLVQRCAEEWLPSDGKMAVICCGPGSMMDDVRAGVVSSIAKGYDEIDFFPEAFHW